MVDKQACVHLALNPGRRKEWRPFPSEEGRTEAPFPHAGTCRKCQCLQSTLGKQTKLPAVRGEGAIPLPHDLA